jgi:hypothetical protein
VSGSAGLHLNIINVLIRMHAHDMAASGNGLLPNVSRDCAHALAQAVHVTAALYIRSEQFMDNSIMCWNAAQATCTPACAAFAAQLNCVQAQCDSVPVYMLQQ